jgi:hypothetical protein
MSGFTPLDGVWFGRTTTTFAPPAPTAAAQNYYDFTSNHKYSALTDLSGWNDDGVYIDLSTAHAGQAFQLPVTGQFWDLSVDAGKSGLATGIYDGSAITWTYSPDQMREPDGLTVFLNGDDRLEARDLKATIGTISDDPTPFAAGTITGVMQAVANKFNTLKSDHVKWYSYDVTGTTRTAVVERALAVGENFYQAPGGVVGVVARTGTNPYYLTGLDATSSIWIGRETA